MTNRPWLVLLVFAAIGAGCAADGVDGAPAAPEAPPGEPPVSSTAEEADLAALAAAVAQRPDDYEARRRYAIALHSARRRDEAVAEFEAAAKLQPNERSLLDLALAYGSVSRVAEAQAVYERLLEGAPGHPIALHNLGNLALQQGAVDSAIELYRRAIASRPGYLMAQSHLADAYRRAGRFEEAYRAYEQVLELEPADAADLERYDDALYQMAALDLTMGAHERAGRLLVELLRAAPEHPHAHYALGQVFTRLGRTEEAQREFEIHARLMAQREATSPVATAE